MQYKRDCGPIDRRLRLKVDAQGGINAAIVTAAEMRDIEEQTVRCLWKPLFSPLHNLSACIRTQIYSTLQVM